MNISGRRRWTAVVLVLTLLLTGCAKKQWRQSRRLDALRRQDGVSLTHVVAAGETLSTIASLYYDDPGRAEEIAAVNGLLDPDAVRVGQRLVLRFDDDEWARADLRRQALVPFNRGVAALRDSRLQDAGDDFHAALTTDPDFADAQYNLALVWLRRGRAEDAEAMLQPLLDRHPDDPDLLLAWGQALFFQTRFDEALAAFDRILARDPDHQEAVFSRAKVLTAAGSDAEARRAWRRYLKAYPEGAWAQRARLELERLEENSGGS